MPNLNGRVRIFLCGAKGCGYAYHMTGHDIVVWLVLAQGDTVVVAEEIVEVLGSLLVTQPVLLVAAHQRHRLLHTQTLQQKKSTVISLMVIRNLSTVDIFD